MTRADGEAALQRFGVIATPRLSIATTEGLGRANAASILTSVLLQGPLARAEIADRVGLTRATVTRVSNRLIELGLLKEGTPRRTNPGRPLVPLELAGGERVALAVHFGAVESRVGVVDLQGRVLAEERDRYTSHDPQRLTAAVSARARDLIERHGSRCIFVGVGASVGGWVEPESGEVIRFDPLGWRHVPLADLLSREIGMPLHLDQFVRGLAVAERMFGAARLMRDFLELWLGNVVGAALVHDGAIRRGPSGASGIVTHFPVRSGNDRLCECGRSGCFVTSLNDDAVLAEAGRRSIAAPDAGIRDLVRLAHDGDAGMLGLVDELATVAGEAAAAMADLVSPSALVVAGLITTAPGYVESFRSSLAARAELGDILEVRASEFGDLAPTIASGSVMLDAYYRDPLGYERV